MQAVILAAGMGKRLKELTRNNTKCMVEVNGVSLIDRMLHQLEKQNLDRIVIVVGYEGKRLVDYVGTLDIKTPVVFVENPIYDKTNNIYSLALAKDYLTEDDTLLFESDIILEDGIIEIEVEFHHRIGDIHNSIRLGYRTRRALIGISHHNGRVKVLSESMSGERKRHCGYDQSSHNQC